MENSIVKKIDLSIAQFKQDVKGWFESNNADISGKSSKSDFLKFIFDHNTVNLSKEDFQRRKRVKNSIPTNIRCCAKRANGEQCTRRKKEECEYCGTHSKGSPYGKIECGLEEQTIVKKRDIWVQDIKGIQYFIDAESNVYSHEDILNNKTNPEIICQYIKDDKTNNYTLIFEPLPSSEN